jgi:hypothetical protein
VPPQRPSAAAAAVALVALLALASVIYSGGDVWTSLQHRYHASAKLTATERRRLPLARIGARAGVFDFYDYYTGRGDRVFVDVAPGTGPAAFATAARFYLLPATVTSNLADATVAISYGDNPHRLKIPFVTQVRLGRKPVYVSRISSP